MDGRVTTGEHLPEAKRDMSVLTAFEPLDRMIQRLVFVSEGDPGSRPKRRGPAQWGETPLGSGRRRLQANGRVIDFFHFRVG